jgi:hypothetical protein
MKEPVMRAGAGGIDGFVAAIGKVLKTKSCPDFRMGCPVSGSILSLLLTGVK